MILVSEDEKDGLKDRAIGRRSVCSAVDDKKEHAHSHSKLKPKSTQRYLAMCFYPNTFDKLRAHRSIQLRIELLVGKMPLTTVRFIRGDGRDVPRRLFNATEKVPQINFNNSPSLPSPLALQIRPLQQTLNAVHSHHTPSHPSTQSHTHRSRPSWSCNARLGAELER